MLSAILKQHRKARSLTQEQVAQALHIDRTTYAYYELGRSSPSIKMAVKFADFYGVTLDALVGRGVEDGANEET
jgi:transcriptional regulator with XRE-family HTH domain